VSGNLRSSRATQVNERQRTHRVTACSTGTA